MQARFESDAFVNQSPLSGRRKPQKRWVKYFLLVIGCLVGLMIVLAFADGIGSGIWWRDASTATCAVRTISRHDTYGKSGYLGTVFDVESSCGALQVTNGGGSMGLDEEGADALGETLQIGKTYEMSLRGWIGWPNERQAIVEATLLP
ncbi:MAG: hypothetical protein JWQ19_652 [Subtercola sp.]|nr:hypothetical protein [Subtercola sp.]